MGIPNHGGEQDLYRFANGGKTFLQTIPIYGGIMRLKKAQQICSMMPPEGDSRLETASIINKVIAGFMFVPVVGTLVGFGAAIRDMVKKPKRRPIINDTAAIEPGGEEMLPLLQQSEEDVVLEQHERFIVYKRVFLIYERIIEEKVDGIHKNLKASESFSNISIMKVEYGNELEHVSENSLFFRIYHHPGDVKPELWNNQKKLSAQCRKNCVAVSLNKRNIPGYYEDMLKTDASGYMRGQQFIPVTIVLENSDDLGDVCKEITGLFNKFMGRN